VQLLQKQLNCLKMKSTLNTGVIAPVKQYCIWTLSQLLSDDESRNKISKQLISLLKNSEIVNKVELLENNSDYCQKLKLHSNATLQQLKIIIDEVSETLTVDMIIKTWEHNTIKPGLLIMDMDSTLVQAETIDEIARVAGVGDKVAEITESAMRGELDFTESLNARVSMLAGISIEAIAGVHDCLPLTEGAENLLRLAKKNGCHTALVSGGFTMFAGPIAKSLGIDTLSANTLEIENGKLTGKVVGDVVDGNSKLDTLKRLQQQLALEPEQIIAIGDGANDLPMLSAAGTGIAFHAKPRVQQQASAKLNFNNLNGVNWFLNW